MNGNNYGEIGHCDVDVLMVIVLQVFKVEDDLL